MGNGPSESQTRLSPAPGWLVHALTASGAVLACLALLAIERGDLRQALLWLLVALAVDGIDGTLARKARVMERVPRIDGAALDLVVDYLNYVFVPTVLFWRAGLVPAGWAGWLAALIQLSALYVFARRDMKTEDHYFRGFPALWNVVAFYLLLVRPDPVAGAIVVVVLALASVAPIHFIHPFRVTDFGRWPAVLAAIWALATAAMIWPDWSAAMATLWLGLSIATAVLLVGLGLVRTVRGPP
jgi:phosphatidylcholine synthase